MENEKKSKSYKNFIVYALTGICIGFLNGFFGGGGGMVAVPILQNILKFDVKKSHATAIFIILPLCITSIVTYLIAGNFNFNSGWYVSIGVILGGIMGAVLLKKLDSKLIEYIFIAIMIIAGFKLVLG